MKTSAWFTALLLLLLTTTAGPLRAQVAAAPPSPEDPAHAELRAVRDAMVDSFNRADLDGFLRHLAPDFVSTWQNAAVSSTPAGVRKFFGEMTSGPVESARVDRLEVDALASLLAGGQAATAVGSLEETFVLRGGRRVTLPCRWTATLARNAEGHWLLSAFHVSTNVFDNPVMNQSRRWTALAFGAGAGLAGLLIGFGLGRARRGRGIGA